MPLMLPSTHKSDPRPEDNTKQITDNLPEPRVMNAATQQQLCQPGTVSTL
ncbi:MAG: hypothetical protein OXC07_10960 [Kistimonas sp.]|nr:hypothetical protein [Kistimonas sp.]